MNDFIFQNIIPISNLRDDHLPLHNPTHSTISEDNIYVIGGDELHIFRNRESYSSKHVRTIEDPVFRPITELKEMHSKFLIFGNGQEVIIFVRVGSYQVVPLRHEAIGFNDAEQFAVLDDDKVYSYMVRDNEDIYHVGECSLYISKPKHEYISLGWGSERTQFVGKRQKNKVAESQDKIPENTDKPYIVWSPSNDMFVLNYYDKDLERRVVKIFSYQCELLYLGPTVDGLQAPMAWKPPQSVIAYAVQTKDSMEVHLYEKLGPIREKFTLYKNLPVKKMQWSLDGEFLGIMQEGTDGETYLSIYRQKTGVWYLKQFLPFKKPHTLQNFDFAKAPARRVSIINILTESGCFNYIFYSDYNISPVSAMSHSLAACAVTNGNKVEINIFSSNIRPPSMGDCIITVPHPVSMIKFHPTLHRILCMDCYGKIYVYKFSEEGSKLLHEHNFGNNEGLPLSNREIFWRVNNVVECITFVYSDTDRYTLTIVNFGTKTTSHKIYIPVGFNRKKYSRENTCIIENCFNSISVKSDVYGIMHYAGTYFTHSLKEECVTIDNSQYLIAFLDDGILSINNCEISNSISSFIVHDNYLHFTNACRNKLYTAPLTINMIERLLNNINWNKYPGRTIESGARLVTGLPSKPDVILQMPRGNFETIRVELIMFDVIENLISKGDWKGAHDYIRMQKMDSNILIDLNVPRFLGNIHNIVRSFGSPVLLSQFIEELSNDSDLVHPFLEDGCIPEKVPDKVHIVCSVFIDTLINSNSFCEYLLPIITSFIIDDPENCLEDIFYQLGVLLDVNDRNPSKAVNAVYNSVRFLKNRYLEKDLFEAALLTYNIKLIQITSDGINKDPKEYKPLLQKWEQLSEIERGFAINDYLQKWEDALLFLIRHREVEDIYDYCVEHDLFEAALHHLPGNATSGSIVKNKFGDMLLSGGYYFEAYRLLISIDDRKTDAYYAAKRCNKWPEAYEILNSSDNIPEKETEWIILAAKLDAYKYTYLAAKVYSIHLGNHDKAMDILLENHYLIEAMGLAEANYDRNRIVQWMMLPLKNGIERLLNTIRESSEKFHNYYNRLIMLRMNKTVSDLMDEEDDDSSLYAESSTGSSRSTRNTKSSSRQRRKMEKKMASLRPGSKFEDIALLRALHEAITQIFKFQHDLLNLTFISSSLNFMFKTECNEVFDNLYELQLAIMNKIYEIWPLKLEFSPHENFFYLAAVYLEPPKNISIDWISRVLSIFKEKPKENANAIAASVLKVDI